jgi:Carboxypeptidase regulatory-like domain
MIIQQFFRSKVLVIGVLAAFLLLVAPVGEFARAQPAAAGGSLVGFIYDKDMKTPVPNAVVKIRNVANAKAYESTRADANGMYRITGIEEGRYVLGVSAANGDFNFDYALALKGNEMAKLSVALGGSGQTAEPGSTKKKSFFTSPAGIVTLVIVAGAVLYALFGKEEETSPIK